MPRLDTYSTACRYQAPSSRSLNVLLGSGVGVVEPPRRRCRIAGVGFAVEVGEAIGELVSVAILVAGHVLAGHIRQLRHVVDDVVAQRGDELTVAHRAGEACAVVVIPVERAADEELHAA